MMFIKIPPDPPYILRREMGGFGGMGFINQTPAKDENDPF